MRPLDHRLSVAKLFVRLFVYCCGALLQGVMVRLMLVLAPVACILAGIGISAILVTYIKVCYTIYRSNILITNLFNKKDKIFNLYFRGLFGTHKGAILQC